MSLIRKMSFATEKNIRIKSQYVVGLILVALVAASLHLIGDDVCVPREQVLRETGHDDEEFNECNLFSGRWVYDNISYPLYKEDQCSFMMPEFSCLKNGRNNVKYQHWRWQPHHCDLPRFETFSQIVLKIYK